MFKRLIHGTAIRAKRPTEWTLPDLDKLPGGFRGPVYNRRNWKEYLAQNTEMVQEETVQHIRPPPKDWRKMDSLPQYLRNKYALREKAQKVDLRTTKRLSRPAMEGIRMLKQEHPELTTEQLAQFFRVSPVAISKIIKSKWKPTEEESEKQQIRWEKRGKKLIKERLVDKELIEFFKRKEEEIGMEIPYFVKQDMEDYVKVHGFEDLDKVLDELSESGVQQEKSKQ